MKTLNFELDGNLGGICSIYAIPKTSFKEIFVDVENSINHLKLINTDDIVSIYTNDNAVFSEEYEKGLYQPVLSGFVPGSNPLSDKHIKILSKPAYWLLLFRDNNGFVRLVGNKESLLTFKYTDTTSALSGINQLSFTFSCKSKRRSVFVDVYDIEP